MPICHPEGRCLIMDAYADYEFYIINYRGKAVSALFKRKAYDAVRTWLSGTGLLSRRCGVMKW